MLSKKTFLELLLFGSLLYSPAALSLETHTDGKPIYESIDVTVNPINVTVYPLPDGDNDGVNNDTDNCKYLANANQLDFDNDQQGDLCDLDDDNDDASDADEIKAGTNPKDNTDYPGKVENQAPTANAGDDETLPVVNTPIKINGTGIDSDGTIATYEWKEGNTVLATTALFIYVPTTFGKHTLTLTVTDNEGATASDSVVVTVEGNVIGDCPSGYQQVYAIKASHPAGSIGSSSNKIDLIKTCQKDNEIQSLETNNIGTFKDKPNEYDTYYSEENRPPNGYSIYNYYSETKYNGRPEKHMYASSTAYELIANVKNDIDNNQCQRWADNFSGGNLNRSDNFWTYFCPKADFISHLNTMFPESSINLSNGLVAHYEFEDNANDSSGNENHGTEHGEISYANGVIGKASYFNGSSYFQYSTIDEHTVSDLTISMFIKIDLNYINSDVGSTLISNYKNSNNHDGLTQYGIRFHSKNNNIVFFHDYGDNFDGVDGEILNKSWLHVVALIDSNTNTSKLFINNNLVKSGITSRKLLRPHSPYLFIGGNISGAESNFKGLIDDIRIYNRTLSETEIQALYQLGNTTLPQKTITGTVKNDSDAAISGINVKFEYLADGEEKSATAVTDASGNYTINIDKAYFDESAETSYLLYAYKEGYHPSTQTLKMGSTDRYKVDFVINAIKANEVVLELEPKVHHLGDDSYNGSVNSQFQKKTEGTSFNKSFTISATQYNNYAKATLEFEAKGIQNFDNRLLINTQSYQLSSSPTDGSYTTYTIELEKSVYHSGSNTLKITSGYDGDYDDFEFSNIVLTFSGVGDTDNDGYPDSEDAFPNDPNEWLDTDTDGIGNNADPDDDNDGLPDRWELDHGLNPIDASDASGDSDRDGASNLDEFKSNSDPNDSASTPSAKHQQVSVSNCTNLTSDSEVRCDIIYTTSDNNPNLSGIGFGIYFDADKLQWLSAENILDGKLFDAAIRSANDVSNNDNDASTSEYVTTAWAAIQGTWPDQSLPVRLFTAVFKASDALAVGDTTTLRFVATGLQDGYQFKAEPKTLNVVNACSFDIDGDGQSKPLTDGLLTLRYLFSFQGETLINGAVGSNATRQTPADIQQYLEGCVGDFDIDGDGASKPLTDGLLKLRYLFGFRDNALINGAVGTGAIRSDAASIIEYMEQRD